VKPVEVDVGAANVALSAAPVVAVPEAVPLPEL